MSRVLVPLDESPLAEEALPWAAVVARARHQAVHLVSVYPFEDQLWELAKIDPSSPLAHARESLQRYLGQVSQSPELVGLLVTTEVRAGEAAAEIAEAAEEGDADMIVITTHGRGGFDASGRGSVADKLVRTARVPVLVVPPGAPKAALGSLAVTLDGSSDAERALTPARALADASAAQLHLLRVIDPDLGWRLAEPELQALEEALRTAAEASLGEVSQPGDVAAVVRGKVAGTIIEYTKEHSCDLLVMATHGRTGRLRLDLGSVADRVVRLADRPVLLVPAAARAPSPLRA
jgi:nucleotide-binding universal stress UspA family protein